MKHITPISISAFALLFTLSACSLARPQQAIQPTAIPTSAPTARPTKPPAPTIPPTVAPTVAPTPLPTLLPTSAPIVQPTSVPPPLPTLTGAIVNGGNVRELPISGAPLDQAHAHEHVELLGKQPDGAWYYIRTARNISGWVSASLLQIDGGVAAQVPPADPATKGVGDMRWTLHTFGTSQITLPENWESRAIDEEDMFADMYRLFGDNFNLFTDALMAQQGDVYSFAGISPEQDMSVLVTYVARPPFSARTILDAQQPTSEMFFPMLRTRSSDAHQQVNGLPASRAIYELSMNRDDRPSAQLLQWVMVSATGIHGVTITGYDQARLEAIGDRIAHSFATEEQASDQMAQVKYRPVTNGGNLREEAMLTDENIIGQVCPGDLVAVLAEQNGWAKIQVSAISGMCHEERVRMGTTGWASTSLLGEQVRLDATQLPPSNPITRLVPFTEESSGISGVRPDTWQICACGSGFLSSSSTGAPDSFTGWVIPSYLYPDGGAMEASRRVMNYVKQNQADGPAPVVVSETLGPDGNGTMIATISGRGSTNFVSVRLTVMLRTKVLPEGVLVAMVHVPEELFAPQQTMIEQMLDSLTLNGRKA